MAATIGSTFEIRGELYADEDLTVEGNFDGTMVLGKGHLTIAPGANASGKLSANAITVLGRAGGTLAAIEGVRFGPECEVQAHITSPKVQMQEGASFNGTIHPTGTEAAIHVARYRANQSA
jgi:cytoskeletal protein CcmA (bactofilin family)